VWGPISRRRGFSLLEVVVSAAVLLGMLGVLYLLLVAGMRLFQQSRAYQGVQQEVLKAFARLNRDLNNSCREHLTFNGGSDPVLRFLSPERPAPQSGYEYALDSARLRWWKWLSYSLDPGGLLVRAEVPLASGPIIELLPGPGPAPALSIFRAQVAPARSVVARQIEQWSVVVPAATTGTYRLRLVAVEQTGSSINTRIALESQVTVLNR